MKVFASDFDGTLFFDNTFRSYDIEAIRKFQSQGHLFGLCSGRPLKGVTAVSKGFIDYDFYIVCSGALIVDKKGNILDEQLIEFDDMKDIFERYEKQKGICVQADGVIYRKNAIPHEAKEVQKIIYSLDELKQSHIYGLSIDASTKENAKLLCEEINNLYPHVNAFQNNEYIDIVKKGCSKGTGICKLKSIFNINEVAGIGDSYNDLPMFEAVDRAFTFTTSTNEIKEKVDDVVDSVCEAINILMDGEWPND